MKLISIYDHMENGAAAVPEGANCKIVFRHSIRGEIREGIGREVQLTDEGVMLARSFGKNLKAEIGFVASSSCDRNIQTAREILFGRKADKKIVIASKELECPQTKDSEVSGKIFEEMNYQSDKILFRMKHENLPGFNSVETATRIMLDFIFSNGNVPKTVDLFCTHDFQMAILYSYLFDFADTIESIEKNKWPMMLEGMILWGTREHFWCSWRGDVKEFCGV